MQEIIDSQSKNRYLKILGVGEINPSLNYLKSLVKAHLTKIPFENISKIYYNKLYGLRNLPGLKLYLEGIEKYNFGGTCYANNYYFFLLLKSLGFEAKLCGADMMNPDVHIAIIVKVNDKEYIVDGGYGAPFLMPIPTHRKNNFSIVHGNDKYVFKPADKEGKTRMDMFRDGKLHHGYTLKPKSRNIDDFKKIIRTSYQKNALFLNAIFITKFYGSYSDVMNNFSFIRYSGKTIKITKLTDKKELLGTIHKKFGIPMKILKYSIGDKKSFVNIW